MNTAFDIAKEVGLDKDAPTYKTDVLTLNLQMLTYILFSLIEENPQLTAKMEQLQHRFAENIKNEQ